MTTNRMRPVSVISTVSMTPAQNVITSSLLTPEETEILSTLLGYGCQSLSTAVIQLFNTNRSLGSVWHQKHFGVLCLVRDKNLRAYIFRLYCLTKEKMLWEHELYISMEYIVHHENFLHIFEAEDCMVAFNFASEEEAWNMRTVVLEKLKKLKGKHHGSTINLDNVVDQRKKKKKRFGNKNKSECFFLCDAVEVLLHIFCWYHSITTSASESVCLVIQGERYL
uniref:Neural Wiskott-Aldrich syndrome protein n=1 Tax=Cacopsylla melanoneura TaxID=428564 RepID=A0A8D8Z4V3_9HEMI